MPPKAVARENASTGTIAFAAMRRSYSSWRIHLGKHKGFSTRPRPRGSPLASGQATACLHCATKSHPTLIRIPLPALLATAIASASLAGCTRVTGYEVTSSGSSGDAPGVGMTLSTTPPNLQPAPDPENTPDDQRHIRRPTVVAGDAIHLYVTVTAHSYRRTNGSRTRPVVVHCEAALAKIPGQAPIRADAGGGGCYGAERLETGDEASATAVERVVIRFTLPPLDDIRIEGVRPSVQVMVPAEELVPTRHGRELGQPVLLSASGYVNAELDGIGPRLGRSVGAFLRGLYSAR